MEVKWKPGPWAVEPFDGNGGYDCIYSGVDISSNGDTVVTVDGVHYGQKSWDIDAENSVKEKMLATANLIAAAPDLYEALQRCVDYIENDELAHGRSFGAGVQARAAISKARGTT